MPEVCLVQTWAPPDKKTDIYLSLFSPFVFFPPGLKFGFFSRRGPNNWCRKWVTQWLLSQEVGGLCSYEGFAFDYGKSVICLLVWDFCSLGCTVVITYILLQAGMRVKQAKSISSGSYPPLPHFCTQSWGLKLWLLIGKFPIHLWKFQ